MDEWQRYQKCEARRASARAAMKRGFWMMAIAGAIWGGMYLYAMSQPGGGSVLIFWGALAFGAIYFLGGLLSLGGGCRRPSLPYQQALAQQAQLTQQWPAQQPMPQPYVPQQVQPAASYAAGQAAVAPRRRNPIAAFFSFVFKAMMFLSFLYVALKLGMVALDAYNSGAIGR